MHHDFHATELKLFSKATMEKIMTGTAKSARLFIEAELALKDKHDPWNPLSYDIHGIEKMAQLAVTIVIRYNGQERTVKDRDGAL